MQVLCTEVVEPSMAVVTIKGACYSKVGCFRKVGCYKSLVLEAATA